MDYKIVEENTIFLGIVGSTAYGTNLPESDKDQGGVCIPPKQYYIGNQSFNHADKWYDQNGNKIDKTIYNFDKIIDLMIDNNPNCLDYLFLPERCILKCKPEWTKILEIRDSFISKKCKYTFSGYAFSQLERIQTHRSYLLNPISKPSREEFKLPEKSIFPETQVQLVAKIAFDYIDINNRDQFYREVNQVLDNELMTVIRKYLDPSLVSLVMQEFRKGQKEYLRTLESISSIYLKDEFLDMANKELRYLSAYNNWKRYEDWRKNRNPKRQELEAKIGWDSKHGSHLLRLLRMGIEILEGKGVQVDRTNIDAEELKNIRLGNVKYELVLEEATKLNEKLDSLYETSNLPWEADRKKIESVKIEILENYLFKEKI